MHEREMDNINGIPAKVMTELGLAEIQALEVANKLNRTSLPRSLKSTFYIRVSNSVLKGKSVIKSDRG
ncbi:MAG: hypothetical protein DRG59_03110 [Deltaproteobacteria bacterium]|nr:MAG: hypothetical protein DRG83_12845 [Deltaproteobacteria bacterium]RLB09177.1 MAG: hypothetical protein DRG59_03110 [Deltaproteobacteria bacterium]